MYCKIIEKQFEKSEHLQHEAIIQTKKEIAETTMKIDSANLKFVEEKIDYESYQSVKKNLDEKLRVLQQKMTSLQSMDTEFKRFISKGFLLVDNLKDFYKKASVDVKQKIIGSIFSQNLVFDGDKYRTSDLNEAFRLITHTFNSLQGYKSQNATVSGGIFELALPPGLEPGTL